MGSDLNCNDNYYVSQNNSVVASFYDRSQTQSSMSGGGGNNEWMQNSGQNNSGNNCQEVDKSSEQKQRNYIHHQIHSHNQHQWSFPPNPYRLYNDNPYGIILSTNSSSQQVPALVPSSSTSVENNTQQNVQQQQASHQIKRVFYQGLLKFQKIYKSIRWKILSPLWVFKKLFVLIFKGKCN